MVLLTLASQLLPLTVCTISLTKVHLFTSARKASRDEKDSYFLVRHKSTQVFEQNMLFPRMYDQGHAAQYEQWMGGVTGHDVDGVKMPTQL